MSVERVSYVILTCDEGVGNDCEWDYDPEGGCDDSAVNIRAAAKKEGWIRNGDCDYCKSCAKAMKKRKR
jgi:hypothetical protein